MCPDPTKGKFILNLNWTLPQHLYLECPLLLMPQIQWLDVTCCYRVPIVSWCSLMTCDVMFPDVSSLTWLQMSGPRTRTHLSLSLLSTRLLARYLLMQGRRCGVDWLLNVITRALSLMSAISRSASAQCLYFVWTIFCRLPLFMLPWSETTREVLFCSRDNETRTHSD